MKDNDLEEFGGFVKAPEFVRPWLDRFFKRGVLSKNEEGKLIPKDFHGRYDIWALFEGFKDIPDDIRDRLNRWELDHYIKSQEKNVMQSGALGRDVHGKLMGAICNCCPDCSFCGVCAKRCLFQSFEYDKKNKNKKACLTFCEDLCRGCGLCAVTCPEQAIKMKKVG